MDRHASQRPLGKVSPPPATAPKGVEAAEFAEYLRAERERRRLTLEQVADETKIASRHLAALERGDVGNWPGGMYRRAMMRAYAESIGVDREFALKQFEQAFEPAPKPPDAAPPRVERAWRPPQVQFPHVQFPQLHMPRWRLSRRQSQAVGTCMLAVVVLVIGWKVVGTFSRADAEATSTVVAASAPAPPAQPSTRDRVAAPPVREAAATTGTTETRPLATEGHLLVASDPPGARVTVNGIGWGETPVTIRHLELGEKRIRLTMQGYLSQERVVRLGPERPSANVRLTLRERSE